ncbi:MAG: VPLPA-CTERM-specific exosortase XrtD [Pikeienuella sp.]|uniref:VPLPA-CTERM-specific exosortase XrtD n=1 Tax=Pikeienuella sp. TaxID=2831957 RepID=UPI00391DAE65
MAFSVEANRTAGSPSAGRLNPKAGPAFLALLILSAIPVFWNGFASLMAAWSLPEYSHGPLIPILSAYLFLRQMKTMAPDTPSAAERRPGVVIVIFAYLVAAFGEVANIYDIVTYALILWVFGVTVIGFGWRRGWPYWHAILHLGFMLPLPQFIYWQVTTQLQFISSEIGVAVIRLMNIPVFLDGNIIDLGVYKLQVAEACSGLRYLFPIMSFTYVFSVLYRGPWWLKAMLLLSAMPLTVLMNSFRIGVIGVLVDNYGIGMAEGFLHYFQGWVIFGAAILILLGMVLVMQRLIGDRRPVADALDIDFSGLRGQMARSLQAAPSRALVGSALITVLLAAFMLGAPERELQRVERAPFILFPDRIDGWRGKVRPPLDPQIAAVLAADDYHAALYQSPSEAAPVDFYTAFYFKQTEGSGIHSPEVCIPGGGWEISEIEQAMIQLSPKSEVAPFEVNRAIIQLGLQRQLVYYWFEQRGRRMTNDYLVKATVLWDSLMIGRQDGALVRLITPILPGESDAFAEARLQRFMESLTPLLPRYIPGR